MGLLRAGIYQVPQPHAGAVRSILAWGCTALAALVVVAAKSTAGRPLPSLAAPMRQMVGDGANGAATVDPAATSAAVLWQGRGPRRKVTHKRAIPAVACDNASAVTPTGASLLPPRPLLPVSLPTAFALVPAAGAPASPVAALPWPPRRRHRG